ncbi:MAG TPA: DUF1697 domain-containing protein [Egibacteraceae bacterium]|nr:DUF1697 domain-containing protein [Egibacteraceae bacterium]
MRATLARSPPHSSRRLALHAYIALLRGINVGGHRRVRMADLRALLDALGLRDTTTYLQSGERRERPPAACRVGRTRRG